MYVTMPMNYTGLGDERVKWSGGKAGDVNDEGIPYGTLVSEVPNVKAQIAAEQAMVGRAAMPWSNILGGNIANPFGKLSTTKLAMIAAAGIVGLVLFKKFFLSRKK